MVLFTPRLVPFTELALRIGLLVQMTPQLLLCLTLHDCLPPLLLKARRAVRLVT